MVVGRNVLLGFIWVSVMVCYFCVHAMICVDIRDTVKVSISNVSLLRFKHVATLAILMLQQLMVFEIP
jgi:hypothetical protein